VNPKALLTAVFVSALLFSAVAETRLIQNAPGAFIVNAETSEVIPESTNFANVTIQSPENKTYNENNVTLAFTIESDIPPVENFSKGTYALYYVHGCVLDNDTAQFVYDVTNKYYVSPNNVPVAFLGSGNRYVGNTTLTGLS
jgi:outer membrane protein W